MRAHKHTHTHTLSLSVSHTHTHAYAHTHTNTHTQTYTHTNSLICTHTRMDVYYPLSMYFDKCYGKHKQSICKDRHTYIRVCILTLLHIDVCTDLLNTIGHRDKHMESHFKLQTQAHAYSFAYIYTHIHIYSDIHTNMLNSTSTHILAITCTQFWFIIVKLRAILLGQKCLLRKCLLR